MTCTFSYAYDQCWRQTSAYSSLGGCHASSATYNALDAPTAWTYGNSLAQSFTYDVLGRVDTLKVGGGSVLNLGYLREAWSLWRNYSDIKARHAFRYSLIYLTGLFAALFLDRLL